MTDTTDGYPPHPHLGGRNNALRALASWRMEWPGSPRIVAVTGESGSGRSRLLIGFLMLCDPDSRKRLPLDQLDPATVPPELPAPAVANARGLTSAQFLWALADHYGLTVDRVDDVYPALAALGTPAPLVVLDVDQAGPVRSANESEALVRDVLNPLASLDSMRLVLELPRALASDLSEGLPSGTVQIVDLDDPEWADPAGLLLHAQTALDPQFGAPELSFTTDPELRAHLATDIAQQAGTSPLVVQLTAQCLFTAPDGFVPSDAVQLPASVAEVLDWHAQRLDADPQTLRSLLAPLALAESSGIPVQLWPRLVNAAAGQDMAADIASGMELVSPFVDLLEEPDDTEDDLDGLDDTDTPDADASDGERMLLRLAHPAIGMEIRANLPQSRAAQSRMAVTLLESVPEQNWGLAHPYVRDNIASHALAAGLLPQLLTDPGLFVHADPVRLRSAIQDVPHESLGAPARTYLRTAPLLTRNELPPLGRAALLETAFLEDGLADYAEATHRLGFDLPWQTLWSLPLPGTAEVTVAELPVADGSVRPVAVLVVPAGTPGAWRTGVINDDGRGGLLVHDLLQPHLYPPADAALLSRPSEDDRAAAPLGLSQGSDYVRIWDRAAGDPVAAFLSDKPLVGVDLSPDGILIVATEDAVKALLIRTPATQMAS
ncbi:ATP-binding protein [Streptomyces sp. B-S-A8]|uniref:ATP-binding protein n=1 Tax=Streptomyces solicavernae TaxID=3043614 RepID=A0ABT6S284_9ACTN|nr:ATP-binding protein [Streptomyces sp. B-S-A8]MDI3390748.1 ATP-binding protein [Streptomyces sp. B-S-A8]